MAQSNISPKTFLQSGATCHIKVCQSAYYKSVTFITKGDTLTTKYEAPLTKQCYYYKTYIAYVRCNPWLRMGLKIFLIIYIFAKNTVYKVYVFRVSLVRIFRQSD